MPQPTQPVSRDLFIRRDEPNPNDHRDHRVDAPVTAKEPDIIFYTLIGDTRFKLRAYGLVEAALDLLPLGVRQQLAKDLDLLRAERERRGEKGSPTDHR